VEVWELVARESIRDLVARYNANGDSGRFEQLLEVFAPDAVMELISTEGKIRRFEGLEAIAGIFTGTKSLWDTRFGQGDRPRHVRHFVATHQIDVEDKAHARGRSYFVVLMAHGVDHWGRYVDRYELRDERWCIIERRVFTDGRTDQAG
jgi:hypothetical protein